MFKQNILVDTFHKYRPLHIAAIIFPLFSHPVHRFILWRKAVNSRGEWVGSARSVCIPRCPRYCHWDFWQAIVERRGNRVNWLNCHVRESQHVDADARQNHSNYSIEQFGQRRCCFHAQYARIFRDLLAVSLSERSVQINCLCVLFFSLFIFYAESSCF